MILRSDQNMINNLTTRKKTKCGASIHVGSPHKIGFFVRNHFIMRKIHPSVQIIYKNGKRVSNIPHLSIKSTIEMYFLEIEDSQKCLKRKLS